MDDTLFIVLEKTDGSRIAINVFDIMTIEEIGDDECRVVYGDELSIVTTSSLDSILNILNSEDQDQSMILWQRDDTHN